MRKSCLFPYSVAIHETGTVVVFPSAQVLFQDKSGEWASAVLVIDSGAALSALPKSDAKMLGITVESGEHMMVRGIGARPLHGWRHEVAIRLGENQIHIPVAFLDSNSVPRVLGRAGVFDRFLIVIDEQKRRAGFIPKQTKDDQAVSSVLDQI